MSQEEINVSNMNKHDANCGVILSIEGADPPNFALFNVVLSCPSDLERHVYFEGYECELAFPTSNRKNIFVTIHSSRGSWYGGIVFSKWNMTHASAFQQMMELLTSRTIVGSDVLRLNAKGNPPNVTSWERLNAIKVTVE